jgi:hypothetical protein
MAVVIFGKEYKNEALRYVIFSQPDTTSFPPGPNISLSRLFSKAFSSSLRVCD